MQEEEVLSARLQVLEEEEETLILAGASFLYPDLRRYDLLALPFEKNT